MRDFQILEEFGETFVYELTAVVGYDCVRDTVTINNVLPNESLHLVGYYGGKGLRLDPLREVIYGDKEEFDLSFSRRKWWSSSWCMCVTGRAFDIGCIF